MPATSDAPGLTDLPIESWLNNWLADSAELAAIIGRDKVYPVYLPAATALPGVVTKRTNTSRSYTLESQNSEATATFRIECQAHSTAQGYQTNARAAKVINSLLSGLQSAVAARTSGHHFLDSVQVADEYDEEDGSEFGDEAVRHTRVIVIQVAYLESVRDLIGGA